MNFRIADTFTDSLTRLTADEQKLAKTTAFDLQVNPAHPGLQFHKLNRAKDQRFSSVRVSSDIRLIVHRSQDSMLLCYVDHHDKAYHWAERRKLEVHPRTGAAQIVEIRERVEEIVVPVYVQQEQPAPAPEPRKLFTDVEDDALLNYGVPEEWLADVRKATEESYLELCEHLPAEAAEALLEIATGGTPKVTTKPAPDLSPFEHPDAQRRFRVMTNIEELERALEFPWEKWTIFLHPDQQDFVERDFNGPARVSGTAGTGKTVVALHRAVHLATLDPDARVLLATFSEGLARMLKTKLHRLIAHAPHLAERIDVHSLPQLGQRLYRLHVGKSDLADHDDVLEVIHKASAEVAGHKFTSNFLLSEWHEIVDAWQLEMWEEYRDVLRLGRKTRLPEAQREILWQIFEKVRQALAQEDKVTLSGMFTSLARKFRETGQPPYTHVVVDEAQDLSVPQLRFFAALGGERTNALFFAGDQGQRIFQPAFSWLSLGIDIRGRSRNLRVNYRTSHQIRRQADLLLDTEIHDADGNTERRDETVSVFNGSPPTIHEAKTEDEEIKVVAQWLQDRINDGVQPEEIGIFVRSEEQLPRAQTAASKAALDHAVLDQKKQSAPEKATLSTMHLAKGMEFRAVVVMACDDEVIPLQSRIDLIGDMADLEEVYNTERHLLYVACTRARDYLLVSSTSPKSEFLDDLEQ